jgi:mono/diheme cytochrome c family protein
MQRKYSLLAAAALVAIAAPVVFETFALGAAADAPPDNGAPQQVQETPQNDMAGWTIPSPVNMPSDPQQAAQIRRGEYLVTAGDCLPCHSVSGGQPFGGGEAMPSPVGAVYTPNISSSKKYGIGNYTDQQFWNVLHYGIAPGSSLLVFPHYLLPSMPYDAYSKLSYPDVMAIKAYLESVPPAETPNRVGQIPFPFDIRAALLGWRIFFFHPHAVEVDANASPQVKNGAFLVQSLEHCNDCHTERNLLFASEQDKFLGGGKILSQSWYAPNITSDKTVGVGGWATSDLVKYLHGGGAMGVGAPVGPMQEVVADSLSRLPESDVADIAAYLQTAVKPQPDTESHRTGASVAEGAVVYADNCARCHGGNGEGVNNNFPNLAGNQGFWEGPPDDLISMILGGFSPWHDDQSNMPAFRAVLTDQQIAAVSNYVRTSWGNKGAADATADTVAKERREADTDVTIDPGTTQATLQGAQLPDVSGALSRTGDQLNCEMDGTFSQPNGETLKLDGSCTGMGTQLMATATLDGKTMPVLLSVLPNRADGMVAGLTLYGPIDGKAFKAKFSYITPDE